MTNRYFKGIQKETKICKIFQEYIENKRSCKSYLSLRPSKQAPIDFLGRFYNEKTGKDICKVAVEVRSLDLIKERIENGLGYIVFPISKLNELMQFWRMGKEVYIVYLLKDKVYFLSWEYYLKHNFEMSKDGNGYFIKLPIRGFMYCGEFD